MVSRHPPTRGRLPCPATTSLALFNDPPGKVRLFPPEPQPRERGGRRGAEGGGAGRRGTEARTAAGEREGGDSPPDPLTRVCAELGSDLIPRPQDDPAAQGRVSLQGTLWREAEPDCVPGHRCLLPSPQTPCCPQRKGREGESGHRPLPTDALASCALSWRPLTAMTKQRPAGAQGRLAGQWVGGPAGGLEVWKQHVRGTQSRAPG